MNDIYNLDAGFLEQFAMPDILNNYKPLTDMYHYVQYVIKSGQDKIKIFDYIEVDGKRQIKLDENSRIIQLTVDIIRFFVPETKTMKIDEILTIFDGQNLNKTVGIFMASALNMMCKIEQKLPIWMQQKLGLREEQVPVQLQEGQTGGISDILVAVLVVVLVLLIVIVCILFIVLICLIVILLLCIVIFSIGTVVAVAVLLAICVIAVMVIQMMPTLIAIYRTRGKMLTELSLLYFQTYDYDGSNMNMIGLIQNVKNMLNNAKDSIVGSGYKLTDAVKTSIVKIFNRDNTQEVPYDQISNDVQIGGADTNINNLCDLNNLLKEIPVLELDMYTIEDKFYDLQEKDMHGILYLFRYPIIIGYIILLHEKLWLDPMKRGEMPILNPSIIMDMFKSGLDPSRSATQTDSAVKRSKAKRDSPDANARLAKMDEKRRQREEIAIQKETEREKRMEIIKEQLKQEAIIQQTEKEKREADALEMRRRWEAKMAAKKAAKQADKAGQQGGTQVKHKQKRYKLVRD